MYQPGTFYEFSIILCTSIFAVAEFLLLPHTGSLFPSSRYLNAMKKKQTKPKKNTSIKIKSEIYCHTVGTATT